MHEYGIILRYKGKAIVFVSYENDEIKILKGTGNKLLDKVILDDIYGVETGEYSGYFPTLNSKIVHALLDKGLANVIKQTGSAPRAEKGVIY